MNVIEMDEFQDTDMDQFQLLRLLCKDHSHLTIVGDDDQQIYSWRGAAGFYNLTLFHKFFHGATITKLEQNFRSTGAIVAAARSLISKNINRTPKKIRTLSPTGTTMSVCECRNEQCEAAAVASFVLSLKEQGIPLREIAILYRLQHVGFELQEMLRARGIPCSIRGHGSGSGEGYLGGSGYERSFDNVGAVVHDILAVLRLVVCESDDLACKQVMEVFCPSFSSSSLSKRVRHLQHHQNISFYKALMLSRSHFLGLKKLESLASSAVEDLSQADENVLESLHQLMRIVETIKEDVKSNGIRDVVMNVLQQVSPFRTQDRSNLLESKWDAMHFKEPSAQPGLVSNVGFRGVKALLKEANQFDIDTEGQKQESSNKAAKSNGFKSLLQQKVARQSLRENYKSLSQSDNNRTQCTYMKKLQSFLDYVYLKLHDGELGTFGARSTSLPEDSQCSDEGMSLDSIVLSTVHQAKGLEWTAVILARVNEGVLPVIDCEASVERIVPQAIDSGFCLDQEKRRLSCGGSNKHVESLVKVDDVSKEFTENHTQGVVTVLTDGHTSTLGENMTNSTLEALEEERRLMYVALTRAKFFLLITHVMLHGQQSMLPSRFLAEIPKGLMHRTTCYESNSVELRDDTTPQAVDGRSPKAVVDGKRLKASKSGRLSRIGGPQDAEVSVKDNQVVATSMLLGKKRACNMISKNTVNIEESLTEIDEALEGMIESKKLRDVQKGKQDRTKGKRRRLYSGSRSIESCSDELDVQAISARGNAKA